MSRVDPGLRLLRLWARLRGVPGGRWLFARILGWLVPYSGTLGATVIELERGRARVELRDRRRVRNHLGSVHAVALANLGELATGLATLTALRPGVRAIVVSLFTEYRKKARGPLVAECRTEPPPGPSDRYVGSGPGPEDPVEVRDGVDRPVPDVEHEAVTEIRDAEGDVVAVTRARWRLRPAVGDPDRG